MRGGQLMRILIVDDHSVVRDGVKKIIHEQRGDVTCGEAGTYQEAIELVEKENWDCMVLDISLGGRSGLELLRGVRQIRPSLPVLILSMHAEEQYARRAFKSGASGYVTKESSRAELAKAIDKVIKGGKYISPALAEILVADIDGNTDRPRHEVLSNREFEVMCLIASGKTVAEIADLLCLSDKTISTYRARILLKMSMKSNAELTYYAIKNGLVN
jgi:two-component system invasion response regulator UvrY